jgi:hypothetical protein
VLRLCFQISDQNRMLCHPLQISAVRIPSDSQKY